MKKYIGMIILLVVQALTYLKADLLGLDAFFALWAGVYGIILFRKILNIENQVETHGTCIEGVSTDYEVVNAIMKSVDEKRVKTSLLKRAGVKLMYALIFISNASACLYFMYFTT